MIGSRMSHHACATTAAQRPHTSVPSWRQVGAARHALAYAKDDDQDVVTRLFGKFFGKDEEEPMGLKRVASEDRKEWYPATTDTWADLLPSDDGEMAVIRPMLANTSLETSPLRLAYDADEHGWSAGAFHGKVNTFGAAVVIGETQGGAVVGGYNPSGWIGLGEDRNSLAAFVFTWPDGDTSQQPVKLPKVGGPELAVMDYKGQGPLFGPDGLRIPLSSDDPKKVLSKLGSYYAKPPDGSRNLFAPGEELKRGKGTQLKWLRAYVAEGGPETFDLEGVVWKSSKGEA